MAESGKKKSHRDRKNPHAAEEWAARKKAANAARPKQSVMTCLAEVGVWQRGPNAGARMVRFREAA